MEVGVQVKPTQKLYTNRHSQQWRKWPCVLAARGCSLLVGPRGTAPTVLWDPQSLGPPVYPTPSCWTWDPQSSVRLKSALPRHLSLFPITSWRNIPTFKGPIINIPMGLSAVCLTAYTLCPPTWAGRWGLCLSGYNHIMPFCGFLLPPQFQTCQLHWQDLASMDSIRPSRLMTCMILETLAPGCGHLQH